MPRFTAIGLLLVLILSCASGGSSQETIPVIDQNVAAERDQRISFDSLTKNMSTPWGEASIEYSVTSHYPASDWPSND